MLPLVPILHQQRAADRRPLVNRLNKLFRVLRFIVPEHVSVRIELSMNHPGIEPEDRDYELMEFIKDTGIKCTSETLSIFIRPPGIGSTGTHGSGERMKLFAGCHSIVVNDFTLEVNLGGNFFELEELCFGIWLKRIQKIEIVRGTQWKETLQFCWPALKQKINERIKEESIRAELFRNIEFAIR